MKYRVTYMATDFSMKDVNGGKSFDKESFIKYLNDPVTKDKIKHKKLYGALSHLWRDKFQDYINNSDSVSVSDQSDWLMANKVACNVIVDMYIKDDKLYIVTETLPTEEGILLAKLYDDGFDIPVSMSTELSMDDSKYYISQIFGLDLTNSPAFDTFISNKEKLGDN